MQTSLNLPPPYPLAWPEGRPRTPDQKRVKGSYTAHTYTAAAMTVEREIVRWQQVGRRERIVDWQLTALHMGRTRTDNIEPGASLWFVLGGEKITAGANLMVLACDRYTELPQNVRALSLTMERLRLVAEVGAYSLVAAVEGARALPPPERKIDWRATFGLAAGAPVSLRTVQAVYRAMAIEAGEGSDQLITLNAAIEAARKELGG